MSTWNGERFSELQNDDPIANFQKLNSGFVFSFRMSYNIIFSAFSLCTATFFFFRAKRERLAPSGSVRKFSFRISYNFSACITISILYHIGLCSTYISMTTRSTAFQSFSVRPSSSVIGKMILYPGYSHWGVFHR